MSEFTVFELKYKRRLHKMSLYLNVVCIRYRIVYTNTVFTKSRISKVEDQLER